MPAENSKNQNNVVATRWIYDPKVRGIIFQAVAVACVAWMLFYFISNALHNMETRGIATGFAFLDNRASFGIAQTLISYSEDDTYGRAFIIGLLTEFISITVPAHNLISVHPTIASQVSQPIPAI